MIKLNLLLNQSCKYIVFVVLCVFCQLATASDLPRHYPQEYEWSGHIDGISSHSIIVEDREFSIDSEVSLHLLQSYSATLRNLEVGMTVGCKLTPEGNLMSLWEFPKSLSSATGPLDKDDINELD